MAVNTYINKLVVGNETKFDLTADTVTPEKLLAGYTAHDQSGAPIVGTCSFDSDTNDATGIVGEVLEGKTFYARGAKLTGTMPNNGAISEKITTKAQQISIPQGYHDGSGKIAIDSTEQDKLIAMNIKSGITILGVEGTYGGEEIKAQATKEVTPTLAEQIILPDEDYDYLAQVKVKAIPVVYTDNAAGGVTCSIG